MELVITCFVLSGIAFLASLSVLGAADGPLIHGTLSFN